MGFEDDLMGKLSEIFQDKHLYGFVPLSKDFVHEYGCKSAIITLFPHADLNYVYNDREFNIMLNDLRPKHMDKIDELKLFLDENKVKYTDPPASIKDDGSLEAPYSYKFAAINAGLGFIGKNDVFVSRKYGQRVRITGVFVDYELPYFQGEIKSNCGNCTLCVNACPHELITGDTWHIDIRRDELVDYKKCHKKSHYELNDEKHTCGRCLLACKYHVTNSALSL